MASTIKVDNVQNQPGTNIVSKCGTDVTLGASGDTIALACGASQTGFGRTGTVDWDTTPKTGTVTAATGKGYFVNTTSGPITVNLPAGAAGSIVGISDYASTADSNNIIIAANGSEKINADDGDYTISTKGLAVTLVYVDGTRGWKSVTGSDADATGVTTAYVTATGGTPCSGAIVCTNYKVHTFTGPGTFCVSCAGNACGSNTVDYLVVAGGGGGGNKRSGAGGAGGYRESPGAASGCYTVSPLGVAPAAAVAVSVQGYPIVVGGGGLGGVSGPGGAPCLAVSGAPGSDSSGLSITSTGGGTGGGIQACAGPNGSGASGGSGGGGFAGLAPADPFPASTAGGSGNTPSQTPPQGNDGGSAVPAPTAPGGGGGGGGATAVGGSAVPGGQSGPGGAGATSSINATPTARAGGGGGGGRNCATPGTGGSGGGGAGGVNPPQGVAGTVNTGGGGGGMGDAADDNSGNGGSGVVIIRYKFQ
jgi:hypothetical protein